MKNFLCLFLLAMASGCGPSFELTVPDAFVALDQESQERRGYELRATTTDGVVVGVKAIEHDVEGSLTFWSDAVTRRIRDGEGYALVETSEVQSADGTPGIRTDFGRDVNGTPYHYTVVVFVTEETLWLLEAAGEEEVWTGHQGAVEAAIASFRIL